MQIKVMDMRGQVCPATLLTALRELNTDREQLRTGEVGIEFLTDNRDATVTVPNAAMAMGYAVTVASEDSYFRISVMSPSSEPR